MTTPNKDIIEILKDVGFSENEADVYLTTLQLGASSAWGISLKSGIKRPTCYLALNELILKGFAKSINDGRRTIYSVVSPKQLLAVVDRKYRKFDDSIGQLEGLASKSPNRPNIGLYEGAEGVKQVYNLTLNQPKNSEVLIYGTSKVEVKYKDFVADYIKSRVSKKIKVKAILPDTPENRLVKDRDKKELRETRFLSLDKFSQETETNIFSDSVAYIAHSEENPFATVIENSKLAKEEKERFYLLWEIAKG